ncbi:hypothetical protein HK097_001772 [Rhizophlyctis rosea]|uniref:Uncharacterized protein n=1 Tax=Rhizophlyctis rosea TaxID=64517 RepID=A0AAD5S6V3_9FUNG|nr:hypothetical protein HK097_001772 [Rhizophlyctis rosea]
MLGGESAVDEDLVAVAKAVVGRDERSALAYLLELDDETNAKPVFDSLPPTERNEGLASYYYSLRALAHVFSSDRLALSTLRLYNADNVLAAVSSLAGESDEETPADMEDQRVSVQRELEPAPEDLQGSDIGRSVSMESIGAVGDWGDVDVDVEIDDFSDAPAESSGTPEQPLEGGAGDTADEANGPDDALTVPIASPASSVASPAGSATSSKPSTPLPPDGARSKVLTAISLSRHHAQEVEQKRKDMMLQSVLPKGTDVPRFQNDEEYRREIIFGMAKTRDVEEWQERVRLAEEWKVEGWEILMERVRWGLLEDKVRGEELVRWVKEMEEAVKGREEVELGSKFAVVHPHVSSTQHDKLRVLYEILRAAFPPSDATFESLTLRIQMLQQVEQSRSLRQLDIKSVVSANAQDHVEDAYVSIWKRLGGGRDALNALRENADLLVRITALVQFEDESAYAPKSGARTAENLAKKVISRLCQVYAEGKIPGVGWEFLEEDRVRAQVEDIASVVRYILPEEKLALLRKVTVQEEALGIPINQRLALVTEAEQSSDAHAEGGDVKTLNEIVRINAHIRMVAKINSVQDIHSGERVAIDRVRQFDEAFGKNANQFAIICMRMIIAGTSPAIVDSISAVLRDAGPSIMDGADVSEAFAAEKLYSEALACIAGKASDKAFEGVFRRGVDSPIAALERVVASVVEHARAVGYSAPPPLRKEPELKEVVKDEIHSSSASSLEDSGEGWDVGVDVDLDDISVGEISDAGEGWDVDVDVDIDDRHMGSEKSFDATAEADVPLARIESVVRKKLTEVAESPDVYGSGMAMDVVSVLGKWFILEGQDAQKLQQVKLTAIIKGAWGIDINESDAADEQSQCELFNRLLQQTATPPQAQSLVAALAEWLPVSDDEMTRSGETNLQFVPARLQDCWKRLFVWMAQQHEFHMLILTRVEFERFDILDEGGEMILLDALRNANLSEYYKHLFLSHREWLASSAGPDLKSRLEDGLQEELASDRLLHILISTRGLAPEFISTMLWPSIRDTILSSQTGDGGDARGLLLKSVAADLVAQGHVSAAAGLTFAYMRSSKEVTVGLGMRFGALVGLMGGQDQHSVGEAVEGVEAKIVRRFIGDGAAQTRNAAVKKLSGET